MNVVKPRTFNYQWYLDAIEENRTLKEDMEKICTGVKELQDRIRNLEIQNRILKEELGKYV